MTRRNCIDGIVTQIQATNGFEVGNKGTAVAYDHRVLVGGIDRAAIVLADSFENVRFTIGAQTEMTYRLSVELFIRHNNNVIAARQDADLYMQNIVQQINNNPTLGGSAFDALVIEGRVEDENMQVGSIHYLMESLTVRVLEQLGAV